MNITIHPRLSRSSKKTYYSLQWGKAKGQRVATGVFTYAKPVTQLEKNHNKEALAILEMKRSQLVLDRQSLGTNYVTQHKLKKNFVEYYASLTRMCNDLSRSFPCSLGAFKNFIGREYISPGEITEKFCLEYREYLLKKYNGETPADYFKGLKRVLKAAKKEGYFTINPAEDIAAKTKPSKKKDILDREEYDLLLAGRCSNPEVKRAAICSMYSALRWVDVESLEWSNIKEKTICLKQNKTGFVLEIPLHPKIKEILGERKEGRIFNLPTQDGANKVLRTWVRAAGINKHITWHSLRHSVSVILQDAGTDVATVAGLLGHTTTKYVHKTYQRYKLGSATIAINKLPV